MEVTVEKRGNRWAVLDGKIVYDFFDTKEEAEKTAKLFQKAIDVLDDIHGYAYKVVSGLNKEEKEFLKAFTGGVIEIEMEYE